MQSVTVCLKENVLEKQRFFEKNTKKVELLQVKDLI